jgi:hypothetical protein
VARYIPEIHEHCKPADNQIDFDRQLPLTAPGRVSKLNDYRVGSNQEFCYPRAALLVSNDLTAIHQRELGHIFSEISVDTFFACPSIPLEMDYDLLAHIGEIPSGSEPTRVPKIRSFVLPGAQLENTTTQKPLRIRLVSENEPAKRNFLKNHDAVIACKTEASKGDLEIAHMAYQMLQAFSVPSLLNIDFADLKAIAKGVGFAFNLAADDPMEIISKLPSSCFEARSGLQHFSCSANVSLNEVYEISKTIARNRRKIAQQNPGQYPHSPKYFRKMNLKMGMRIRPDFEHRAGDFLSLGNSELNFVELFHCQKRIELTTILFGL